MPIRTSLQAIVPHLQQDVQAYYIDAWRIYLLSNVPREAHCMTLRWKKEGGKLSGKGTHTIRMLNSHKQKEC